MGSSRLPGKVMKLAAGKPLIQHLLERLAMSELIDAIVLATSKNLENDEMENLVTKLGYKVYRVSENDVLDRYYQIAKKHSPEIVLRIPGDCPLIDYQVTDKVIQYLLENDFDYVNNSEPPTYPDGLDFEIFERKFLSLSYK